MDPEETAKLEALGRRLSAKAAALSCVTCTHSGDIFGFARTSFGSPTSFVCPECGGTDLEEKRDASGRA